MNKITSLFGKLRPYECPYASQGCSERFRSHGGRTNHVRSIHENHNIVDPTPSAVPSPSAYSNKSESESEGDEDFPRQHAPPTYSALQPDLEASEPEPGLSRGKDSRNRVYHPHMTGAPCDSGGNFLPPHTKPPPRTTKSQSDWSPFEDERQFRLGDFLYRKVEMSAGNIDELMDIWSTTKDDEEAYYPFDSHEHMYDTIDSIKNGDTPWKSFTASYAGTLGPNPPSWQLQEYTIWYRDPTVVISNMLDNPDFDQQYDYRPYIELEPSGQRTWNEFMSGNFAWRHANQIFEDDPTTEGATYCPIGFGADKTTCSVATGQVEYHPFYLTLGGIHNTVRRGHRNGVAPIAFLAIPKSDRKYDNDVAFRRFKRQLYHSSITFILKPLKPGMSIPVIHRCPDGHFRKFIYDLAAFIADYPEQVYLAGTVQGWCPKCTAIPSDIDGLRGPRTRELHEHLINTLDSKTLWFEYGIDDDIIPFTHHFPRADIHEMLTPDLLHQVIKGTFKDHLVSWVSDYLDIAHTGNPQKANDILDDIDRRIAAAPLFPELRRFPHGRRFKQWTGDDSKALMKVYLHAICGHVPDEMVQAISAFLDACYIARRSDINEAALAQFDSALERFYQCREIFRTTGVRPDGFSLPRQHSLSHYHHLITEFGAPNGICSSITESRHITAVKKPWRRSNRYEALGQMLLTNQRLDKLHAARVDFVERGMLASNVMKPQPVNLAINIDEDEDSDDEDLECGDTCRRRIEVVQGNVVLARTPIRKYPHTLEALAEHIHQPQLVDLTRRFLYDQLNIHSNQPSSDCVDIDDCPVITSRIYVFHSAIASFYSPSDSSGIRGMCTERIRSCPLWRKKAPRHDCAFVVEDDTKPGMRGMNVVRIQLFFSFVHNRKTYPCALVEWFSVVGRSKDPVTGMWKVKPDIRRGNRLLGVIHLDTILRGAHLLPVFKGGEFLPVNFQFFHTLDAFAGFYVNHYADHHMHEIVF